MRLVSDFDGVWTFPAAEAEAQGEILDGLLEAALPEAMRAGGRDWIGAARAAVAAEPRRYGWSPRGRLSAFGDEDPFAPHSGLVHYVCAMAETDPVARAMCESWTARGRALEEAGAESHAAGVARVVSMRGPAMVPAAGETGRAMLAAGVEVVVVSNSPNAKLAEWFAHAGLDAVGHPERRAGAFRLRGGSRKFEIDADRHAPLHLGDLAIETARPAYERVLREERPDAVIGDVFSLDLALPLRLRRTEPEWRDLRILWLLQPYTPRWLRARVEAHAGGEVECVEGGLAGVPAALQRAAGS